MSSPEPGRPRRVLKRVAIALAFLLGTGVVAFWVSAIWGRSVLNSYAAAWKLELAEERARLAARRLPVLSGQPLEENAAPRYTRALAALDTTDYEKLWWPLEPGSPLTPELSRLLEKHRADLAPFLEALRCTRCDWETAWEEGYDAHVPDFHACQMIASLLILEGEERAFQGDGRGAARRYMEAIRFGADVGAPGNLVQVMGGIAETQRGLNAPSPPRSRRLRRPRTRSRRSSSRRSRAPSGAATRSSRGKGSFARLSRSRSCAHPTASIRPRSSSPWIRGTRRSLSTTCSSSKATATGSGARARRERAASSEARSRWSGGRRRSRGRNEVEGQDPVLNVTTFVVGFPLISNLKVAL
ncbi:hypothetical protein HY251_11850 [bacterium]|nr:hypothetical protein [bacterium]